MLTLYSSGGFVRVFADARGGGSLFVTVRKASNRSVTVRRASSKVPAQFSSQLLALCSSGRFIGVFIDARGGDLFIIIRQSGASSIVSSGGLVRVFAGAREGAGAVRC